MKRGDLITFADRKDDYGGKPRPGIVVQSDHFDTLTSITICPITSAETDAVFRVSLAPSEHLPLRWSSKIAVDKISTIRRQKVGPVIGHLSETEMQRFNAALLVFLGIG